MSREIEITGTQHKCTAGTGCQLHLGGQNTQETLHKQPARLIAALAESDESRLRLALIPLFLDHHKFALHVQTAVKKLDPAARLTLQCYYTAAVWLCKKHRQHDSLPDHFSRELGLQSVDDLEENLRSLAKRHKELSGTWEFGWALIYTQRQSGKRGYITKGTLTSILKPHSVQYGCPYAGQSDQQVDLRYTLHSRIQCRK